MKILDCTLRDGGYYNNWDFDMVVVDAYLNAVAKSNIDVVELGLRSFQQNDFLGPFAYTTESFLSRLQLPIGPQYGVMIDAKTILSSRFTIHEAIQKLFVPKSESKISLVRIAAHFHEVEKSQEIAQLLKSMGYIVGFNLMQAGGKPTDVIQATARMINNWGCVDVLYFADSLGNMNGDEVKRIINALRTHWVDSIGIHTHNNMGQALDNTLTARQNGVAWLDVTVTGMGRGAGNAQIENLLVILSKESNRYPPAPIYDLVIRFFDGMQKKYGWGSNLLYFIGAQNNVHPTYVQKMISDKRYGPDEIVGAIDYLSRAQSSSFSGDLLDQALMLDSSSDIISGDLKLMKLFSGREVLIIGNGPSVDRHRNGIIDYIKNRKPIVLVINYNDSIEQSYVDLFVISHNSKYLSDQHKYKFIQKTIVLPLHRFNSLELSALNPEVKLIDYGLKVQQGIFEPNNTYCVIPSELTAAYAIGVAITGEAKQISLVGFDGYEKGDPRQEEMTSLFMAVLNKDNFIPFIALTPTTYPVNKGSIYAPVI